VEEKILKSKSIITSLIIALVVLLAVNCFMGMDYLRQRQKNEAVTSQIAEVTQTLADTPEPPQDLEQKLAEAEASLADAQNALPRDINGTQVINAILKLADACEVKAIPLSTRPWSADNIGKGYYVFRINMAISGSFPQLTSFVSKLKNGEFESLVVESLSVTRVPTSSGETGSVTASLGLAIYTKFTSAM
jgi:Tfp pilus assembly protein PilO